MLCTVKIRLKSLRVSVCLDIMWISFKLVQDDNGVSANRHAGYVSGDAGTSSDVPKHFNLVPGYLETCFSLQIPKFQNSCLNRRSLSRGNFLIVLVESDRRDIAGWSGRQYQQDGDAVATCK